MIRRWLREREIHRAAAVLIDMHLKAGGERTHRTVHDFKNCTLDGVPIQSWRIIVEPVEWSDI